MNKVILMGRVTADPQLSTTPNGVTVCKFNIAVNRRFKNANGDYEADFISCVAWRQTAEFISNHFPKGRMIGVVGSLQSRTYDKDGQKHFITEVHVEEVYFTGDKGNANSDASQTLSATSAASGPFDFSSIPVPPANDDDLPF